MVSIITPRNPTKPAYLVVATANGMKTKTVIGSIYSIALIEMAGRTLTTSATSATSTSMIRLTAKTAEAMDRHRYSSRPMAHRFTVKRSAAAVITRTSKRDGVASCTYLKTNRRRQRINPIHRGTTQAVVLKAADRAQRRPVLVPRHRLARHAGILRRQHRRPPALNGPTNRVAPNAKPTRCTMLSAASPSNRLSVRRAMAR